MNGAKLMSGLFSKKKKTMVPHKWRSENFVTFYATIGQVYDANTKLLGVFFRQKDTWVGTLGLKRCLPMLGYENLEWKQTLILLALTIKTRKQAITYATVFEKKKKKYQTSGLAWKFVFAGWLRSKEMGPRHSVFRAAMAKLCYKNAEMKLRCKRNTICSPTVKDYT